jgi:spermidine/putrescine transport system substrate-binding protein
LSRRQFLHTTGRLGAGVSAAAFLAACGIGGSESTSAGGAAQPKELPPLAKELAIAQWPAYINKATVPDFEKETGIDTRYNEIINDNAAFYAKIRESLSRGEPLQWDIIALSDWVVTKMNRTGWLEPLDHSLLPNVKENIGDAFADPSYDPGNAHSIPWQGGITGIAYNKDLVDRPLTSFSDLFDPALEGRVGMLTEMVDSMNMTLLMLGIEPQTATVADAEKAQQRLLEQRDAGIVRDYYGNEYVDGLARKDLYATMAWSGDIFWLGRPEIEFVVPEEGGLLWVTPLEIPLGAEHPRDAHEFMDFVYDPEIATNITEYVGYITPVPEVQDILLKRAKAAEKEADREYLEGLANSPLVFPTSEMQANLHSYKVFTAEEEQEWNALFDEVVVS